MRRINTIPQYIIPPAMGSILMILSGFLSNAQYVDVVIDFSPEANIQLMDIPISSNPLFITKNENCTLNWFEFIVPLSVTAGITITAERLTEPFPSAWLTTEAYNQISDPQPVTYGKTYYPANSIQGKNYCASARRRPSRVWIGLPAGIPLEVTIAYF